MHIEQVLQQWQNREPTIMGEGNFRKYGILLPFIYIDDVPHIVFEVRSKHLRSQPGDVCFPGGRIDETDPDAQFSALRETEEELGIPRANIQQVTALDYVVSDAGRLIYPFVGVVEENTTFHINPDEVSEYFTVPFEYFLNTEPEKYKVHLKVEPEEDFPYELIYNGEDYNWNTRGITELFYQYKGRVIWGLTAKILTHFIAMYQQEQKRKEKS
ncbi:MAG TPA: CoA pyrophosphatase [Pseudogracilibacillus sp.]|nr:CoA pyrophosphatase [Pseudogracilibacillus sp.]